MLTDEARQAIAARLSQSDTPTVSENEAGGEQVVAEAPVVEAKAETPETAESAKAEPENKEEAPAPPKMVPLDEVVRLRKDRRVLRDELEAVKLQLAEMKGRMEATKQKDGDWIDDLLKEPAEQPDPRDAKISELEAFVNQMKAQQGQALLDRVLAEVRSKDDTVDDQFVIDRIAIGRTPEQALAEWGRYKARFAPTTPIATQPVAPAKQPPKAPPTVERSTSGKASGNTPKAWGEVQQAVRQALSSR